jgi:hypothetical protein
MRFRIPNGLSATSADELRRAYIGYGPERSPAPTRAKIVGNELILERDISESGPAFISWDVPRAGRLLTTTTTLMEKDRPYNLLLELARGKVNQVRNQYADWQSGGLDPTPRVDALLRVATRLFGQAILDGTVLQSDQHAEDSLATAFSAADEMVRTYIEQVFKLRHERQDKFETTLSCQLNSPLSGSQQASYQSTFNAVHIPLTWAAIETRQGNYRWKEVEEVIAWAVERQLPIHAGPLIDFSEMGLPKYVLESEPDAITFKSLLCDYVETVVSRYRGQVSRWVVATGGNSSTLLGLGEEDLIRLTAIAADAAWQVDSGLEIVFGMSQPGGDYMAQGGFDVSPFAFADTLLRAGLPFAGIELDLRFGTSPNGNYCRDMLETSRILDLFGILGVPVQVLLGYPSSRQPDMMADPREWVGGAGYCRDFTASAQAEWVSTYASLAMCKSYVNGITWDHFSDADPHLTPHGGLVDARGVSKPALDRLRDLRLSHLK